MRKLGIAAAGALAALVLFFGALLGASELQEVVVLHSQDEDGAWHETRLWVVDYSDRPWLRAGGGDRPWLARVRAKPQVRLARGDALVDYTAKVFVISATRVEIDRRMLAKYGWPDAVIRWLERSPRTTPVRLDPR